MNLTSGIIAAQLLTLGLLGFLGRKSLAIKGIWLFGNIAVLASLSILPPWFDFAIQWSALFALSFSIYRHNWLALGRWNRAAALLSGPYYMGLAAPLSGFFPSLPIPEYWGSTTSVFSAGIALYLACFGLIDHFSSSPAAPQKTTLELPSPAFQNLMTTVEHNVFSPPETPAVLAAQTLDAIRETYWQALGTPLKFAQVTVFDESTFYASSAYPESKALLDGFNEFLRIIKNPASFLENAGFEAQDIQKSTLAMDQKRFLLRFINSYDIGYVLPCTFNEHLRGVVILGSKQAGRFGADEKAALARVGFCLGLSVEKLTSQKIALQ